MPNNNVKIIIENKIPFVKGLLDEYATVSYLAPEEITPKAVREADGMMIRTRTKCNAELLDKSDVMLIATATIGTDHIDAEYCAGKGITVVNAPGCNAPAVAQYVFGSLMQTINRPLSAHTIAVVGVGHVGEIVARWAKALDMKVLLCDPPRQRAEGGDQWVDMETIAREADIITIHTPLTREGEDKTFHMLNREYLSTLRRAPIIINSARGEIADTEALIAARRAGQTGPLIIDCWENEPEINRELLELSAIATPHIAGYSAEGKVRASQIALDAITTFFMLPRVTVQAPLPPAAARAVSIKGITESFDPTPQSEALKARPEDFEEQRNTYPLRAEAPEGRED